MNVGVGGLAHSLHRAQDHLNPSLRTAQIFLSLLCWYTSHRLTGGSRGREAVAPQIMAQQACFPHGYHGAAWMQSLVQQASLVSRETRGTLITEQRTVYEETWGK